jgi:hypothetical protein
VSALLYDRVFTGLASVAGCYAASRVEIGKQPGAWEGTYGGWLASAITKVGILRLKQLNLPEDQTRFGSDDELLAMRWTASSIGVPPEYETMMKDLSIIATPTINTVEEGARAIANGNPIIIGSQYIPTGRRGKYGISPVSKSGGHLTFIDGVFKVNGIYVFHYQNSWSENWAEGERYPDDMPPGSCNIDANSFQQMLTAKDAYALVDAQGLKLRTDSVSTLS